MLFWIVLAVSVLTAGGVCLGVGAFCSLSWLWMIPAVFLGAFLLQALVIFVVLWLIARAVDPEVTQQEDSKFHRFIINMMADTAMPLFSVRLHTRGLEKTPKSGRFMLVCNHLNNMDPVTLVKCFSKSQLAFISKRENASLLIVGKVMHKILCQPINRENDREALKTIINCINILKEDKASIAVFPEGYVSTDCKLHPFRNGVFKIALKTKVPIVVCTLQNTQYVFRNAAHLRPTHVHMHLLDVIMPEEYAGMTTTELGSRIHRMMAEDLGPENVLQEEENADNP